MDRKKAIALSFSVPVAWGFSYPLMKIGMDSMNATSIVALRCIIAFVACLLLFHKHALRINRDLMVRASRRKFTIKAWEALQSVIFVRMSTVSR